MGENVAHITTKFLDYAHHVQAPDHVLQFVSAKMTVETISTDEGEHVIDYLVSAEGPKRLNRATYEQMKTNAAAWLKAQQKKGAAIAETSDDTTSVLDFGDGFRIVRLVGKNAYKREGFLMAHCVASYYGRNVEVYSLRDAQNMPHATMEKNQQLKGKGNGDIHPKYVGYVVKFLEHIGMTVGPDEMQHLGYLDVQEFQDDLHADVQANLYKNRYWPKEKPLLAKDGAPLATFLLWKQCPPVTITKGKLKFNFNLQHFIKRSIEYIFSKTKKTDQKVTNRNYSGASSTGNYSGASSSGNYSGASSSGYQSGASSSGYQSGASSTGNYSGASSSGNYSGASSSGDYSGASSSGNCSGASSSGDYSGASSSGYQSGASSSGYQSGASSSGYQSGASSTGNYSGASSSGNCSRASSSGDYSTVEAGPGAVGLAVGFATRGRGKIGGWLVLTECGKDPATEQSMVQDVRVAKIDGTTIKEDTWYTLTGGQFVEWTEEAK